MGDVIDQRKRDLGVGGKERFRQLKEDGHTRLCLCEIANLNNLTRICIKSDQSNRYAVKQLNSELL